MLDLKNVPKLKQIQIFNIRMPSDLKLLGITNALIADIYNYIWYIECLSKIHAWSEFIR